MQSTDIRKPKSSSTYRNVPGKTKLFVLNIKKILSSKAKWPSHQELTDK